MLQILGKMKGSNSKRLQNTSEMAASSSKVLQIARETDRTGDPPKIPKRVKTQNYPGKSVGNGEVGQQRDNAF